MLAHLSMMQPRLLVKSLAERICEPLRSFVVSKTATVHHVRTCSWHHSCRNQISRRICMVHFLSSLPHAGTAMQLDARMGICYSCSAGRICRFSCLTYFDVYFLNLKLNNLKKTLMYKSSKNLEMLK